MVCYVTTIFLSHTQPSTIYKRKMTVLESNSLVFGNPPQYTMMGFKKKKKKCLINGMQ